MASKKRGVVSRRTIFIIAVVIIVVGIFVGYFLCNRGKGEVTPVYSTPEEVRDAVMSYIRVHHPDAAWLVGDIKWSGGDVTPEGIDGGTTYQYTGDGWNVTISWPVVPEPTTYEVTAAYRSPTEDLQIVWRGTVDQDGTVTEKIKTSYQGVECVRDAVMEYIKENHPDAAVFIEDLEWSGGRETPPDKDGYETYVYTGNGWTVTIGYAVYYDTVYEAKAENKGEGITWTGTVHDGTVSETSYERPDDPPL